MARTFLSACRQHRRCIRSRTRMSAPHVFTSPQPRGHFLAISLPSLIFAASSRLLKVDGALDFVWRSASALRLASCFHHGL